MAGTAILRTLIFSTKPSSSSLSLYFCKHFRLFSFSPLRIFSSRTPAAPSPSLPTTLPTRCLCSSTDSTTPTPRRRIRRSTAAVPAAAAKTNFSLNPTSESDSGEEEEEEASKEKTKKQKMENKLPPPYDPFSKKNSPAIEEPKDPKNLQEIFHKMRTEGLFNNALKMFDALSKDGLTHEALELFAQIKDKAQMPDVVAHTAVIEAYASAGGGHSKDALKAFVRMLASGVAPNAYTYSVLIKGLAADARLADAKKYLLEMMEKGMKPNAATYTAVFEGLAREEEGEEGREFLEEMKGKGFVADERAVREVLKDRRGQVVRRTMSILFGNN